MAEVDRRAPDPVEVLIGRAGAQVARVARQMLDGRVYGKRVVVVAGPGNNGADGTASAALLRGRGALVEVLEATELAPSASLRGADLVIDAAYGTGLRRPYRPPDLEGRCVLAVDIPSGISGTTGEILEETEGGGAVRARHTVTFAALKPGLLLGSGPAHAGIVELADIGLGAGVDAVATAWLVTDEDVAELVPRRTRDAHKWQSALQVVAGSPGMTGAPWLVSRAALRAGAGYVRLGVPGMDPADSGLPPSEVVSTALPETGWAAALGEMLSRCRALVVGPGLGPAAVGSSNVPGPTSEVSRLVAAAALPTVIDADGLGALGGVEGLATLARRRGYPTIVTPHAGEFERLVGVPVGSDRVGAVRDLAARTGAIVLLKGSTTVVGHPDGRVLLSASGGPRLATAGTGDVLSGVIGALLARGVPAWEAAGIGAHLHGRAAEAGRPEGLVASDLPELVSGWLSSPWERGRPARDLRLPGEAREGLPR